jgi:hypothetical protein
MLPKRMKTCLHKNLTLIAAFLKMVRWQHNSNAHEPVNDILTKGYYLAIKGMK